MSRIFFRLYLLLVATVIGAGWSIESLWQHLANTGPSASGAREAIELIEMQLSVHTQDEWPAQLDSINRQLGSHHELLTLDDLAGSARIRARLQAGEAVSLQNSANKTLLAKRLTDTSYVLAYHLPMRQSDKQLENLLLAAFYLAIAAVLFLWIWPLHRDLRRMEAAAHDFGEGEWRTRAAVRSGSALSSLAHAFNHMAARIGELVNSHKELTNAVSHEFRTPLARMRFALEAARENGDVAERERVLDGIGCDIDELERLVQELLEYAAIERQGVRLQWEPVDYCAGMREEAERVPNDRGIKIRIDCELSMRAVNCDWRYMQRLLQNLLVNAVRHAARKVQVSLEKDNAHYTLCVEDDGAGVREPDRQRIFEPFVRVVDDAQRKQDGFGLGLAIVRRIAEWHGGYVEVTDSTLGGARFIVRWPVREEPAISCEREDERE